MLAEAAVIGLSFAGLAGVAGLAKAIASPPAGSPLFDDLLTWAAWDGDDGLSISRDGGCIAFLRVEGRPLSGLSRSEQEASARVVVNGLIRLFQRGAFIRFAACRDLVQVDFPAEFDNPVLAAIHEAQLRRFERAYVNRRYIVLSFPKGKSPAFCRSVISEALEIMGSVNVRQLGREEVRAWYGNRFDTLRGGVGGAGAATSAIALSDVEFDRSAGRIRTRVGDRCAVSTVLSVSDWGEDDSHQIVDGLLALPGRVEVWTMAKGIMGELASMALESQKTRLLFQRGNASIEADFREVQERLDARDDALTSTHFFVVLSAETEEALRELSAAARAHLANHETKPIVETRGAGALWLARNAGGPYDMIVRPRNLTVGNLASLHRFESEPEGIASCDWGPGPLRLAHTAFGRSYRFNLHVSTAEKSLAHTLVLAPSRGGKTVWIQHLIGGALRHPDMTVLAFDFFAGMQVFCEAVGGSYVDPVHGSVGFNPLQLSGSPSDMVFLQRWLAQLARATTNEAIDEIERGLVTLMASPPAERRLDAVMTAFSENGTVRRALERWANGRGLTNIVAARKDGFALNRGLTCVDLTALREDPEAAAAVMSYCMYRVRRAAASGRPHMIVADEMLAMLQNPVFVEDVIKVGVRQHGKLRGGVIMVVQDFAELLSPRNDLAAAAILTNAQTKIIYPNPDFTEEQMDRLQLSADERLFVAGNGQHVATRHMKRPFLFLRGTERLFLESDLRWLGPHLRLYEGGPKSVVRMQALKERYGDQWPEKFIHTNEGIVNGSDVS